MKKAFTMMELIFVLIVIGILAAVIMPEMKSNKLREAAIQVISHIRYTQHLAMVDDKFDINDDWYKGRWQMIFSKSNHGGKDTNNGFSYSIYSDSGAYDGNPNLGELAKYPMSSDKYLSGGDSGILDTDDPRANKKMNIGESYDVSAVDFTAGCAHATVKRITFDHLGRPIQGTINGFNKSYVNNKLIQSRCEIVLTSSEGSITIAIEPETGYAHILES